MAGFNQLAHRVQMEPWSPTDPSKCVWPQGTAMKNRSESVCCGHSWYYGLMCCFLEPKVRQSPVHYQFSEDCEMTMSFTNPHKRLCACSGFHQSGPKSLRAASVYDLMHFMCVCGEDRVVWAQESHFIHVFSFVTRH